MNKLGVLVIPLLCALSTAAPLQNKSPKFAAASLRLIPAGTPIMADILGIACRGSSGVRQTVTAVKLGVDPILVVPQGRCVANGVTLQALIAFSYGVGEFSVSGGPNWARMSGPTSLDPGTFTLRRTDVYAIEAIADDPTTATIEELRQMLRTFLTERFNLKSHRETRQVKGYALVVGKNGPRLKEVKSGYDPPRASFDETLRRSIKGTSTLTDLLDALLPSVFGPVVNKTGLKGVYQYEFFAPLPPPPPPPAPTQDAQTGRTVPNVIGTPQPVADPSTLTAALEAQLGLRLQTDSVAVEMIVIDQAERPSPN